MKEPSLGHAVVQGGTEATPVTVKAAKTKINRIKRLRKKKSKRFKKVQEYETLAVTVPVSEAGQQQEQEQQEQKEPRLDESIVIDSSDQGIQSSQQSSHVRYSAGCDGDLGRRFSFAQSHHAMPRGDQGHTNYRKMDKETWKREAIDASVTPAESNTDTEIVSENERKRYRLGEQAQDIHGSNRCYDYGVVLAGSGMKAFVHGNYHRYYGYRLGTDFEEDPRLGLLEKRWFHKKKCLDIGCNEGVVTLDMVLKFGTASMMGIDLDEHLIKRACAHLKEQRSAAINTFVLSQQAGVDSKDRKDAKRNMQSLAQTWFIHGNVLASNVDKGSFDCITAFSVIKWIHLHGGDGAVRYFFSKICELLAPGGRFILEPQPWKSYKSAAQKMKRNKMNHDETLRDTYFFRLEELRIRPEDFCTMLPKDFGLAFVRELHPPLQTAVGFDRTLYMFQKVG